MDDPVLIALISIGVPAFLTAVATPIIVARAQAKSRRQEKEDDWKRADVLEQRAVERAAIVAKRAEERAQVLVKATVDVREIATTINGKIDEVHVLVNSSYTAALQATKEAVQAKLVVLLRDITFNHNNNIETPADVMVDLAATRKTLGELTAAINERLRLDVIAKEEKAKALLLGKQQSPAITGDQPLPVTDNRTAEAGERSADALERSADAAERANSPTSK